MTTTIFDGDVTKVYDDSQNLVMKFSSSPLYPSKQVMVIKHDSIWVDPEIEVTEAAALVLAALGEQIKTMIDIERNKALREAAENCFGMASGDECARMIKGMMK